MNNKFLLSVVDVVTVAEFTVDVQVGTVILLSL